MGNRCACCKGPAEEILGMPPEMLLGAAELLASRAGVKVDKGRAVGRLAGAALRLGLALPPLCTGCTVAGCVPSWPCLRLRQLECPHTVKARYESQANVWQCLDCEKLFYDDDKGGR